MRKQTKQIRVGDVLIGGGAPVVIQSMLSVPSTDLDGNVAQARRLEEAGCRIVRVAVPDESAVALIPALKAAVSMPVVADIHFDYRLALACVAAGVDKIRINPGNIGSDDKVRAVAEACGEKGVPIRIGVNSGSLERHILEKYGSPTAEALVESAAYHASLLERFGFTDIVLSLKSSDLHTMIEAYRLASERFDYPLHLGVTEAGTARIGLVKSAIGIGSLLADGIGDTIRVSLTADPAEEIAAAKDILRALGEPGCGVQIVSCPTCGRTAVDLERLVAEVESLISRLKAQGAVLPYRRIAVMGCPVNGPGEARDADLGVAGTRTGQLLLFCRGEVLGAFPAAEGLARLEELLSNPPPQG